MDQIKQAIYAKILMVLQNPHTSGSAIVIGAMKIAGIIWPQRKATFDEITAVAVIWLGINAGDASKSKAQVDDLAQRTKDAIETRDTTQLLKKDVPAALQPISPGRPANPSNPS